MRDVGVLPFPVRVRIPDSVLQSTDTTLIRIPPQPRLPPSHGGRLELSVSTVVIDICVLLPVPLFAASHPHDTRHIYI